MVKNKVILSLFVIGLVALLMVVPSCKKSGDTSATPSDSSAEKPAEQPPEQPVETPEQPVAEATELVPLEIELPKPMFVGTPTPMNIENLEKPLGKERPLLQVPKGVKMLSLDKPVTSSDDEPIIGDLEQAVDGDKEGIDGSWVELGPGKQWLQIDLEKPAEIYAIVIWHYHREEGHVYKDVVVQVADDADFISNVRTLFNNDIDNSSGLGIGQDKHYVETAEGKLIPAKGVKAQYVRLYSNGNTSNNLNHYTEVEIFGK